MWPFGIMRASLSGKGVRWYHTTFPELSTAIAVPSIGAGVPGTAVGAAKSVTVNCVTPGAMSFGLLVVVIGGKSAGSAPVVIVTFFDATVRPLLGTVTHA